MAVATWPEELPEYLERDSFSEKFPDTRIRSEPDTGPALVRRRSTVNVGTMSGTLILNTAQLTVFRDFWDVELDGGTLPFYWVDHTNPSQQRLYRFGKEPPEMTPAGYNTFKVSLQLEILP